MRQKIISAIGGLAAIVAIACAPADKSPAVQFTPGSISTASASCSNYTSQAPETLIQKMYDCIPELKKAKDDGRILGVFYNPSQTQFQGLLLESIGKENQDIIDLELRPYSGAAQTFPSNLRIFGMQKKAFIVITPELLAYAPNPTELSGIIKHELVHVDDIRNGISLSDKRIDYKSFDQGLYSATFASMIIELRGYHSQVQGIANGPQAYSRKYIGDVAGEYNFFWQLASSCATNDYEKDLAKTQLDEFSALRPIISGTNVSITTPRLQFGAQILDPQLLRPVCP